MLTVIGGGDTATCCAKYKTEDKVNIQTGNRNPKPDTLTVNPRTLMRELDMADGRNLGKELQDKDVGFRL